MARSAAFTQREARLNWLKTIIPGIKPPKTKLNAGFSRQEAGRQELPGKLAPDNLTTKISHPQEGGGAGRRGCKGSDDC